jgi:hypothetical protein
MLTAILFSSAIAATAARGVAAAAAPDACHVLSMRDIARVQGAKYTKTRLTETTAEGMTVSQCYYTLPKLTDSVTVDLIRGNARKFWEEHFENPHNEAEAEPEEKNNKPREIGGVGEDAVWSGNRLAGALYVLSGDTVLRVSVGGGGAEDEKIEKSKRLAARVIAKMRS